MDRFGRQREQSDSAADSFHQRHSHNQSQQRLPPFRTLLSENGSHEPDQTSYNASNGYPSSVAASPRYSNTSSSSRALTASPIQSRPAPMPSLSQGFDDFNGRYPENTVYPQMQPQRAPEYMLGPGGVAQYQDLPIPYPPQPVNSQSFEAYQPNPNLPSIREMPDRRERILGSHGNNGNVTAPSFPSDNLSHYPNVTPDVDQGSYASRRPHFYDQNHRSHTSYPALGSGHVSPPGEFSRYGQPSYESPNRAYSSLYGDIHYSPQPANGSQQPNFGVLGDSNDPRSKRRRGNLPKQVTDILRAWFHEHLDHPYPTEEDKQMFIARTGLSISQISNWFINARRRQLPSLRNQVRSQEHGLSSHSHVLNEREHFSSQESSLSPR